MPTETQILPLERVLESLEQRKPMRAGSLIVSVFGDAIAPRGGTLWLGSLLEIMALFGIEAGLVRTALSRLVQENWFERTRVGKNSFYRLSSDGAAKFAEATRRIYHAAEPAWDGAFDVAILVGLEPKARLAARDELAELGFGQSAPTVMLRPSVSAASRRRLPSKLIWLSSRLEGDAEDARRLGAACWQLDPVANGYARFIETFGSLSGRSSGGFDEAQAFRLRVLLIHEYRRVILRDPMLPHEMLPKSWPGFEARRLCRQLYRATLQKSERWLDAHGQALGQPLPPPEGEFAARFGGA